MWLREPYTEMDISKWLEQGKLTLYQSASSTSQFSNTFSNPHKILLMSVSLCDKLNIKIPSPRVNLIIKRMLHTLKIPGRYMCFLLCLKSRGNCGASLVFVEKVWE